MLQQILIAPACCRGVVQAFGMVLHGCVLYELSLADLAGLLFFALLKEVGLLLLQELRDAFLQIEQLAREGSVLSLQDIHLVREAGDGVGDGSGWCC